MTIRTIRQFTGTKPFGITKNSVFHTGGDDPETTLFKNVADVMKALNEKSFNAFIEANFGEMGEDSGVLSTPTLAQVLDEHPGLKLVVNKVKKNARSTLSKLKEFKSDQLLALVEDVIAQVSFVFEPNFVDAVICLMAASAQTGCDFEHVPAKLTSVPSLLGFRKVIKQVVQSFGGQKASAMSFVVH